MWTGADIRLRLDDSLTDGDIATAEITTPVGVLMMLAEVRFEERCLRLVGVHTFGADIGPNQFGPTRLRWLAQAVMEVLDCDEIIVEGAVRTTGAGPGRRPGRLRFARALPAAAGR